MTGLTLTDCRPEVLAFAVLMEAQLRANDHKPGWKDDRSLDLAYRAREEADELRDLLWDTKAWTLTAEQLDAPGRHGLKSIRERIAGEAADTANMAMMAADVSGALPQRFGTVAAQPMASAPLDRPIILITFSGFVVKAKWVPSGFEDAEMRDGGAWVAAEETQHPPCWSEGACWASNADEMPSDPPIGWLPMPQIMGASA
ncbi:hypothetical protein [Bosea sp. (in: a-proteobacteria)]|uniref:hypothetical protein n=1 Tax=Bosea sp. (in: a-proteobacteria) TaxID=1871050 RepID=UPI003B3A29DE